MIIVEAQKGDRGDAVALWHEVGLTRPWNDPQVDFDVAIENSTSAVLLARDGVTLIGTAMVGFDGHRGWVYYLGVLSDRRGQGIARSLMSACEDWLRARHCPKIQLMLRTDNAAATRFYAAMGYDPQDVVTLGRRLDA